MENSEDLFSEVMEEEEPVAEEDADLPESEDHSTAAGTTATTTTDKQIVEKTNEIRHTQLPLSRIRNIMKLDPEMNLASNDCVFLITKATELFIQSLAKEAFIHTTQAKKKTIQKKDIDSAISSVDSLMFLEGSLNF